MRTEEVVVLPSTAIVQGLGLAHVAEQIGAEELIPDPAVE